MSEAACPELSLGLFEPLLGQSFQIGNDGDTLAATLIEATNLRETQGAGRRSRQFSLVWRAPPGAPIEQRIHRVSHPALPPLELFLVCIGPDVEGMRYEAVFT
ncbi:hypothetical protein OS187_11370 [Xanthomonadaceae bacterium JHOS43]|nr:hypothetical protein [Xanthomonadaceae bacterium JHOS43]MCX7564303.1 hypothetical protein [Xanthomonadaceae bacterium XH05]